MRLVVVVAVLMTIQKKMELHPHMIRRWSLLHRTVVSGTVSPWRTASHLEAALLDVVKLQAERLYAAYDSPLVTKQTDPNAPDVTEGRDQQQKTNKKNSSNTDNQESTGSYSRSLLESCFCRLLLRMTHSMLMVEMESKVVYPAARKLFLYWHILMESSQSPMEMKRG